MSNADSRHEADVALRSKLVQFRQQLTNIGC